VIDEWDREYTKTYTLNVINTVIPVTSLELTVDGQAVSGNYTASAGGKYSRLWYCVAINTGYSFV
jgi:hypothetical protein